MLTMARDQGTESKRDPICSRCTAKTMTKALVENDGYNPPHSQERPSKRQKTEGPGANSVIVAQQSPGQTVQSNHGEAMPSKETETPMTATTCDKSVHTDPETLNISKPDELLEDLGKPSCNGVQQTQSRKSSINISGSVPANTEGEQQEADLSVPNLAGRCPCNQIAENNIAEVFHGSSQASSPQPPKSSNQEASNKHKGPSQSSTRSLNNPVAEDSRDVEVEGSPTQSLKRGIESSNTGSCLPQQKTVSKDSVVSFPRCTSCGTKRVFNTPRNGETYVLW